MIGSTSGLHGLGGGIGIKSTLPGWGKRGAVQTARSGFSGLGASVDLDRCKRCKDAPPKAWEDPQGAKWCIEHVADCASAAAGAAASAAVDKVGNKIAGKGKTSAARQQRTGNDLARGDVKIGDVVPTNAGGTVVVTAINERVIGEKLYKTVELFSSIPFSISKSVMKNVRPNGDIFYTTLIKLQPAAAGGNITTAIQLSQLVVWNGGFFGTPANTKVSIKIGNKWEPFLPPFGGDPSGTTLRASNQWATGITSGGESLSKDETTLKAADKAESAAAAAAAKAGKPTGTIWEDAALALAISLIESFKAKKLSDIPAGFRKMTDEGTFKAAFGGKRPGTSYSSDSGESAITPGARATGALKWGAILGLAAVAVVAVVGVVFMLRKRRTATA